MKPEDIHWNDWLRIFAGDVPGTFYIELVIRAIAVYLLLMISMRLMGKRMSSQLGRNELAALVSLAAAIGVPLQAPDRGILPAFIIAFVVVFTERFIAAKTYRNQRFEQFAQGNIDMLVKDSVIDMKTMKRVRLTRERLAAQLRGAGIKQLGKVKRFYMEANGAFTLIEETETKPGLSLIPAWDEELHKRFKKVGDILVCETCGFARLPHKQTSAKCTNCGDSCWAEAVE